MRFYDVVAVMLQVAAWHIDITTFSFCRDSRSKYWEKKQLRPYSDGTSTWQGKVFGVQCFYGFDKLDTQQGTFKATFGGWLPDDAVRSVREWLDTVRFKKCAQVRVWFTKSLLCGTICVLLLLAA